MSCISCSTSYILVFIDSNVVNRPRFHQKPMTSSDFERVEHELNIHMNPSNVNHFAIKSLQNTTGWSSGGIGKDTRINYCKTW